MKRHTGIAVALAAVAAVAALGWAFAPRPLEVELGEAVVGPFETTVDEDGRTRLRDRYVVSAPLAGRLARITLREGDAVAAGDPVATLTPALSPMLDERARREQQARLGAAEAALAQAGARVGAARVALERARVELARTEQLAGQGFVAPTKIDADRLAADAARMELQAALEGEHVGRHELQLARAALAAARGDGGAFTLRSPVAGRVLKVDATSETTVPLGAPLVEIGDTAQLEIVAELLTVDALAATPGRAVRIERWGGPTVLAGRVRRVEPAAFTKVSALGVEEQRVNVIVDITSPRDEWAALGDGFRVALRIVTLSEPQALTVPVSAVFPRPGGEGAAVFVVDGGRARLRPVSVAARNGSRAWLTGGLAAGARVVVYPPASLADGARIRARSV